MKTTWRILAAILSLTLWIPFAGATAITCSKPLEEGQPLSLTSPSAILAEAETGTVIFEKNADERREAASITKLMTALLVMEAIDRGDVTLQSSVTVSKNAAAQKGSQALLDADTAYSLEDLLRTTIMASANDSAVALAEYLCGTEEAFAARMNQRAKELGMNNTNYVNATGYPKEGQYTTARDVMLLSCAVSQHPMYFKYSSVWLDTLKHPSGRVTDLTNTNRLVRFYQGCDGFKTGSTDAAKYCLSATCSKNGMRLVAVVLGTPVSQTRFNEARAMMDYGFAAYQRTVIANKGDLIGETLPVKNGSADTVELELASGLSMLLKNGEQNQLKLELSLPESVEAPVTKGDVLGTAQVLMNGQVVAKLNCVAAGDVPKVGWMEGLERIWNNWR